MRTALAVLLLGVGTDDLTRARDAMRRFDYPAALTHFSAAERQPGLDVAQLVELYELQGVALATLKNNEAGAAFRKLLALSPEHRFSAPRPPRVMTYYYEARDWLKRHGPLQVKAVDSSSADGVTVELSLDDPLSMAEALSVKVNEGANSRELSFPVAQLPARVTSTAASVELSVTVIGARRHRLHVKTVHLERPAAAKPLPNRLAALAPAEAGKPTPRIDAPIPAPAPFMTGKRMGGVVLLAVGVAATVVGASFGAVSNAGRQRWARALDGSMPLASRDEAVALSNSVQSFAIGADVLFAVAGVLGLSGLGLLIFGGAP